MWGLVLANKPAFKENTTFLFDFADADNFVSSMLFVDALDLVILVLLLLLFELDC